MENSSRFFKNTSCSYFPCHKGIEAEDFNCLFCYCPFYSRAVCPGNPDFIKKEDGRIIKRCTACTFPHQAANYDRVMSLLKSVKTEMDFTDYHHGDEACRDGEQDSESLFSVNTNSLGLPESVRKVLSESLEKLEHYPDKNCTLLREKIAQKYLLQQNYPLSSENIICGNGASELISVIVRAISPKNALIVSPTFSGYERALKNCDCRIRRHLLTKESSFTLDETILTTIKSTPVPDLIFICSPNNPTGRIPEAALFETLVKECEKQGSFLFIDESFIDFSQKDCDSLVRLTAVSPHLIVLNAFTKIYAMAGLRLGYAVTSNTGLLAKTKMLLPEWNVSNAALIAGGAALDDKEYLKKTKELIKKEREYLSEKLKDLGFTVYPSEANFILFEDRHNLLSSCSGDKSSQSQHITRMLRNCGNFIGLNDTFWRTAVRKHEENERLVNALQKALQL